MGIDLNSPEMQAILLLLMGIVFIVGSSVMKKKKRKILENGIETEGVIFQMSNDGSFNNDSYPIIRFITKKQEWITEQYDVSGPFLNKPGKKITVVYNPDNPKEFVVKTAPDFLLVLNFFIVIGFILLIIGGKLAFDYLRDN